MWLERCAEKGFTAPIWPTEFAVVAGLAAEPRYALLEEMANARENSAVMHGHDDDWADPA